MKRNDTAIILGFSGLTGSFLRTILNRDGIYSKIVLLGRTKPQTLEAREVFVALDEMYAEGFSNRFERADVFCLFGTTINKAGSREEFYRIDVGIPLSLAGIFSQKQGSRFFFQSSLGADPDTGNFYLRVKGETEKKLREMNFFQLVVLIPSLLIGERKELRFGEKLMHLILPLFSFMLIGKLKKYRAVNARAVATVMAELAKEEKEGTFVVENDEIMSIYNDLSK